MGHHKRGRSKKLSKSLNQEELIPALCGVREKDFADLKLHGNTKWRPRLLVQMAVLWAWGRDTALTERWKHATQVLRGWFPDAYLSRSYQGFIKALTRKTTSCSKGCKPCCTLALEGWLAESIGRSPAGRCSPSTVPR